MPALFQVVYNRNGSAYKSSGTCVQKQSTENLRAAAAKAREIVQIPDGLANDNVMKRKRGLISDESCIEQICDLVSEGATVYDALRHVQLRRQDWYEWVRRNHCDASDKYQEAALCYLELMADRTLKVFEDFEAKREAAKRTPSESPSTAAGSPP
ncbi:MAG: hypothetical protein ACXWII_24650, partial [Burkholderiales bacterium]